MRTNVAVVAAALAIPSSMNKCVFCDRRFSRGRPRARQTAISERLRLFDRTALGRLGRLRVAFTALGRDERFHFVGKKKMGTRAVMPQSCRCGQAEILDCESLDAIMAELSPQCRTVLSTCRCTAARISEASASSCLLALARLERTRVNKFCVKTPHARAERQWCRLTARASKFLQHDR